MLVRASTSTADTVREPAAKETLIQLRRRAGCVAKIGRTWARKAGVVLRGDATRFVKGAGKALVRGGQAIVACSGTSFNPDGQ